MKKIICLLLLFYGRLNAQTVTLSDCYGWAQSYFPLSKQKALIKETNALNINTLEKNLLPQIDLNAQATYQSDVTQFPVRLPNVEVTPLSKDQYKVAFDARQIVWDGGIINMQKSVINSATDVENQKVEVELYKIKERINQLYFSILQVEENVKLIDLLKTDVGGKIKKIQGAVDNGVALKMTIQALEAENLKADQRIIELKSAKSAAIKVLTILTNQEFTESTKFEKPIIDNETAIGLKVNRPELVLFDLQKKQIDQMVKVKSLTGYPRLFAFGTGGYGRPGFNFLKNEFALYGLVGLKMTWNISELYAKTIKNDLQVFKINQQSLDIQRDIFMMNTKMTMQQQSEDMVKYQQLIEKDRQIVALRQKIKATASVQLENGVLTASEYLSELNAENQAMQNLVLHELQLLMTRVNLKTVTNEN